jgi:hypothetical protein
MDSGEPYERFGVERCTETHFENTVQIPPVKVFS